MGEMMNIQKEKVRKVLVSLCLGELTAVLSFVFADIYIASRYDIFDVWEVDRLD